MMAFDMSMFLNKKATLPAEAERIGGGAAWPSEGGKRSGSRNRQGRGLHIEVGEDTGPSLGEEHYTHP